jgi:transposase
MPKRPDPKVEALRREGALNPRPGAVKDELFQHSEFFDPRDLVQVRYELVRRVHSDARPVAETAKRFGVSRPTYYKLSAHFEREGLTGLLPRKRGPKGGHKLRAEVIEALQGARAEDPSLDSASLVALAQQRFGVRVHPRTLERALKRQEKKRR